MPTDGRYVVTVINDAVGVGNPAQMSFDCADSPLYTTSKVATQIAFYIAYGTTMAVNSRITGVSYRANGAGGSVPALFDAAHWDVIRTALPAYGAPAQTGYGFAFGSGVLTPLGTSATVLEETGLPGRRTTGRKYLPFISSSFVTVGGALNPTAVANISDNYFALLVAGAGALEPVYPVVKSSFPAPVGTEYLITGARVMSTLANLRRRRR